MTYSLRSAAKVVGVSRFTLRRWLEELGYQIPEVSRGSKVFLNEIALKAVVEARSVRKVMAVERYVTQ